MRTSGLIAAASLLLAACGSRENAPDAAPGGAKAAPSSSASPSNTASTQARWDFQSSGEGSALALLAAEGRTTIRLFCTSGDNSLLVNVPAFRPIASEERLSFGGGGEAEALVADPRGDAERGGVSGTGAVPANLGALIAGPVSVSYGAQTSGPHSAPPEDLSRAFAAACAGGSPTPTPAAGPTAAASPCLMQGSQRLRVRPLRAVGTEPFWGARIEGRCVTYSHIEDQDGTRAWTRYTPGPDGGGAWVGALGGRRFELRVRARPGCSDGMSDKLYPLAVDLVVGGEQRSGCAEPF